MKTKVIKTRFFPDGKFLAITLFGLVFTRHPERIDARVLNHELIHCRQQLEWLYIPFFLLYVAEWIWYLLRYKDRDRAYRSISFEKEAYRHEGEKDYLKKRPLFANYRKKC